LLHLLLLQVCLDVHPHPPLLLLDGGVLVCVPVVVGEILPAIVVHPLVEMVGNIKTSVVIGGKLIINEYNRVPVI